jgi:hypothetical protein
MDDATGSAGGADGVDRATSTPPARDDRIRIVYIAGAGKSGSTLIDRVLASSPNAFSVGQLENLRFFIDEHDPRRRKPKDRYCDDQGFRLRDSPFWKPVIAEMERGNRVIYDPRCPMSVRRLLRTLAFGGNPSYLPDFDDEVLYRTILAQARAAKGPDVSVVVDSSKELKRLIALRRVTALDVFVLHLVRDVRGVAYSREKKGLNGMSAFRRWVWLNTVLAAYLRAVVPRDHYLRLSYDLFTRDPAEAVRRVNGAFGLKIDADRLIDAINADVSWRFSGDGMRREPVTAIRADPAWRTGLSKAMRRALTVLGWIPNRLWVYRRLTT